MNRNIRKTLHQIEFTTTYLFFFLRLTAKLSLSFFVFLFVSPFISEIRSSPMFLSALPFSFGLSAFAVPIMKVAACPPSRGAS